MSREPHYLGRANGDRFPVRLVTLDCDSAVEDIPGRPGCRSERLHCWAATGWERDHHGRERWWSGDGQTVQSLWDAVYRCLKRESTTWIVSHMAGRVWGLADLWGKIERSEVQIVKHDHRGPGTGAMRKDRLSRVPCTDSGMGRPRDGSRGDLPAMSHMVGVRPGAEFRSPGNRRNGAGYVVLEDPPFILSAKVRGQAGQLKIIDLRNYGIESYPNALPLRERVRWLADVMHRMVDLLSINGWGSLQDTAGSQAMYTFRRSFLTHSVEIHANPAALALEKSAYVGGRCEARRLGHIEGPVYHVDVRAMYPACCLSALPTTLARTGEGALSLVSELSAGVAVGAIAEAKVATEEAAFPAALERPARYPIGRFWTVLCGPELADALDHGRVLAVGRWALYRLAPALRAYSQAIYDMRCRAEHAGDAPLCQWLKRLNVSLPGKFGQKGWRWEPAPDLYLRGPWQHWFECAADGTLTAVRSIGWQGQRQVIDDWANDAVPAIAAWVCSLARMRLLRAIRAAGWKEVYYYDTDSLLCSEHGFSRLVSAGYFCTSGIGQWRVVNSSDDCRVWGPKHYRVGDVVVCAGVPKGAIRPSSEPGYWWARNWLKRAVGEGSEPSIMQYLIRLKAPSVRGTGRVDNDGWVSPQRREE